LTRSQSGRGCAPGEGTGIAGTFEMMLNGVAMEVTQTIILRGSSVAHKRAFQRISIFVLGEVYSGCREERMKSRRTVTLGP
jgi:hypothetical protein